MKQYTFPESYQQPATQFCVTAQDTALPVYSCDVSAYPLNRVWPGKQRDKKQTEKGYFVTLGSDDSITLNIVADFDFETVTVRPLSRGIVPEKSEKTVSITFPAPGQYCVEFDNMHRCLCVFINPENCFSEIAGEDVLYFGAGVHIMDERLELSDNQTVIIDEGAVFYGSINASQKKNIKILGYGIIDNSRMKRANEINGCAILAKPQEEMTGNPIFLDRCENVLIDGVTIVDSSGWNIYLDGCKDIVVNNIKLIGQWRYNADGCDFCNCTNGVIRNSFLRTFDDCITVKGFKLNNHLPIENILAENCVLWCDWGKALEVGAETCAPYIRNITFRDCDVVHGGIIMLDIQQGDRADIDDVLFENIRIEYSGNEMLPVLHEFEEQEYTAFDTVYTPIVFTLKSGVTMWSIDDTCGTMQNITFRNISITSNSAQFPAGSLLEPDPETGKISRVFFENITFNGERCDQNTLGIQCVEGASEIYVDGVLLR